MNKLTFSNFLRDCHCLRLHSLCCEVSKCGSSRHLCGSVWHGLLRTGIFHTNYSFLHFLPITCQFYTSWLGCKHQRNPFQKNPDPSPMPILFTFHWLCVYASGIPRSNIHVVDHANNYIEVSYVFSIFSDICRFHGVHTGLGFLAGGTLGGSHQNFGELWKVGIAQDGFGKKSCLPHDW